MIEHHSVVNRLMWMQSAYPLTEKDVLLQKTPVVFDVSVWELFWWGLTGASLVVLQPGEEKEATVLQEVIGREQVSTMHFVPSMLSHFLQVQAEEEESKKEEHKLRSLRQVFTSGEALQYGHAEQFGKQIGNLYGTRLINLYGPTEATVDVSYYECDYSKGVPQSIPIGKPIDNIRLYILDQYGNICPIGVAGELCIAGVGVARGYLNNAELTEKKFRQEGNVVGERLYHTGDLARWQDDGNIEYLGRIDSQVKLRGLRIELEEIQVHLSNHAGVTDSVVMVKEQSGDQVLVAYYVAPEEIGAEELRKHLGSKVPEYMVPGYFVQLTAWPVTMNGKLNRKALPAPEISRSGDYAEAETETEQMLVSLWGEVLKLDAGVIGIHQSFFELGGNSLRAMTMISKIVKRLQVKLSLQQAFIHDTIHTLAKVIDNTDKTSYVAIERAPEKPYYATTPVQKSLYFLNEYDTEFLAYNMPRVVKMEGSLDKAKLIKVIETLIARHEVFRTGFVLIDKEPVQIVHKDIKFEVQIFKANSYEETQQFLIGMIKPFDLTKPPLIRAGLVEVNENEHYLMVDIHHIVFDGISSGIMIRDFANLYNEEALPELRLQYKDFADWQNSLDQQLVKEKQRNFWKNEFSGGIPVLNLPTDYNRPLIRSHEGKTVDFNLSPDETKTVKALAEKQGTTLFMVLLSAYYILLSKITGQDDIVVGTTTGGRNHDDLQQMLGMFLSSLPLRNKPQASLQYNEFLKKVKKQTLECFENQGFDFSMTLDFGDVQRDMSQNALFNVVFMLHNFEPAPVSIPGLNFTTINWENVSSKFDLTLTAKEIGDVITLNFEYCTKLFKEDTIDRYAAWYKNIITQITSKHDIRIAGITLASEAEELQIVNNFNTQQPLVNDFDNVVNRFDLQVEKTPAAIALQFGVQSLTYKVLQERANKLANYLLANTSASKNNIVALYLNRSAEMVIAMLAVLKSGSAFVCIDPEKCPADRLRFILKECDAKTMIINSAFDATAHAGVNIINLASATEFEHMSVANPEKNISLDDLAYVIFTSGSTGVPKGVMISHSALADYTGTFSEYFEVGPHDRVIQMSAFTFDTSIEEIFPALTNGACVVMLIENNFSIGDLAELIRDEQATILSTTPLILNELNRKATYLKGLRAIISGGDVLKPAYISNLMDVCPVYNTYGPSETTVCVTYHKISNPDDAQVIGKPIRNKQVLILDEYNNLVPVGLQGEICVSGEGLAIGYLQDELLTNQKFVQNPVTGNRMYKTGDVGKWREDGSIEFLGRKDKQIKIRGIRIEPGEIETSLALHKDITDVIVTAKQYKQDNYLIAYYVAGAEIPAEDLKAHLTTSLPDYMIPSFFIHLNAVQRNASGKIDTHALPDPEFATLHVYKGPETLTEAVLVKIWAGLLGINEGEIGVETSFFHIGGHSLNAMSFVTEAFEALDVKVPLKDFFIKPTIRATAAYIDIQKSFVSSEYLLTADLAPIEATLN
ncbi:amino acid adenylation domain-containing protein [Mucilaginibacter rubeus]|uniref:Amino acid adenylation domain-containing protein n=2 Tax=Mucilaginibacter rubeus TaxID=2027860 RepID=A0A5C1I3V2_9SPHI|nr:amino acid adenylation domain-containing protein [Mucilaginibacter rubeus]